MRVRAVKQNEIHILSWKLCTQYGKIKWSIKFIIVRKGALAAHITSLHVVQMYRRKCSSFHVLCAHSHCSFSWFWNDKEKNTTQRTYTIDPLGIIRRTEHTHTHTQYTYTTISCIQWKFTLSVQIFLEGAENHSDALEMPSTHR